ncbi:MAG TPA: CheR family methyltransferase [Burkholderiales bacterium]|nr:CheR family methyltransferase [Burkholderiales bacterium]
MASVLTPAADPEFAFTDEDFERVRGLIHQHAGIALSDSKRQLVYSRLGRRLRARSLASFRDYLEILESDDAEEWEAFTNALTTNLTSFFREEHHFPILAAHLKRVKGRQLVLWCTACSTGEEPYSMAITAAEAFDTLTPPVRILASDVDTNVLAKAEAGIYPMDRFERMPPERLRRFFLKGSGPNAGHVKIRPEIAGLVTFRQVNLLHDNWPMRGPLDAIFCRNVMIYFDKATQYSILKKFVPLLANDGLFFAGHSENFIHAADLFRLRGKTVYELSQKVRQQHASARQR